MQRNDLAIAPRRSGAGGNTRKARRPRAARRIPATPAPYSGNLGRAILIGLPLAGALWVGVALLLI
jgi:hypothetical protein